MIDELVKEEAQKSAHPEQAIALFDLMSQLSEERFCARWVIGNESMLWECIGAIDVNDELPQYGDLEISLKSLVELWRLLQTAQCWWIWEWDGEPTCIPLSEWKEKFDAIALNPNQLK